MNAGDAYAKYLKHSGTSERSQEFAMSPPPPEQAHVSRQWVDDDVT